MLNLRRLVAFLLVFSYGYMTAVVDDITVYGLLVGAGVGFMSEMLTRPRA